MTEPNSKPPAFRGTTAMDGGSVANAWSNLRPRSLIRARNNFAQRREALEQPGTVGVDDRAVADLAPGPRALAVVVQMSARNREHCVARRKTAQQVQHRSVPSGAGIA